MNKKLEVSILIEKMVRNDPNLSYIDALILYAEKNDLEYRAITKLISPSLKEKIYNESVKNKLLKVKSNTASLNEFIK